MSATCRMATASPLPGHLAGGLDFGLEFYEEIGCYLAGLNGLGYTVTRRLMARPVSNARLGVPGPQAINQATPIQNRTRNAQPKAVGGHHP
jgi:hypothetical protein